MTTKRKKPIFIIVLTIAIIGGIGFFVIRPVITSVFRSWRELTQARINLKTIQEKKGVLESLKGDKNIANVASVASAYIPKEADSGQLIIELTAMAQANDLTVQEITLAQTKNQATPAPETTAESKPATTPTPVLPKELTNIEQIKEVEFSLKIAGTFPNFMKFLRAIETSSRLVSIKDISMQAKEEKEQQIFSAQMAGVAYYKKEITLADSLENIKISNETITKLLNLKTYGQPINLPGEAGFGRTNPFENY